MNTDYIFKNGKILESFNYINEYDLANDYIGHLVDFNGTVYQIVTDTKNNLLNPEEPPEIVSENVTHIYDFMYELDNTPAIIGTDVTIQDSTDDPKIIDGKLVYRGMVIEPIPDDEDDFSSWDEYVEDEPEEEGKEKKERNEIDVEEHKDTDGYWDFI